MRFLQVQDDEVDQVFKMFNTYIEEQKGIVREIFLQVFVEDLYLWDKTNRKELCGCSSTLYQPVEHTCELPIAQLLSRNRITTFYQFDASSTTNRLLRKLTKEETLTRRGLTFSLASMDIDSMMGSQWETIIEAMLLWRP